MESRTDGFWLKVLYASASTREKTAPHIHQPYCLASTQSKQWHAVWILHDECEVLPTVERLIPVCTVTMPCYSWVSAANGIPCHATDNDKSSFLHFVPLAPLQMFIIPSRSHTMNALQRSDRVQTNLPSGAQWPLESCIDLSARHLITYH